MTKREKVLVGAMAGAVVWVGVSVGFDSMRGPLGSANARKQKAEIRVFAEAQQAKMVSLHLQAKEKLVLDQAAGEWANSPLIDRMADTRTLAGRAQQFIYTGFIHAGEQQYAIINGREYRVSEPVGTSDFQVESIHPDHVVLISGSGGRRMTIALQPFKARKELP